VDEIKEIGSFAGLAAFLGLAVLSLLYFSQARDVRRLRDWAGRAPERDAEEVEATSDLAAERAEELRKIEEERHRREEAAAAEQEATAKRERRRERREAGLPELTRRERIRERFSGPPGGRGMPEPRYMAVAVGAVIVLGVGAAAATGLLGGDGGGNRSGQALKPSQVEVAVLNGTSEPGLAGRVSDKLSSDGFDIGKVGNSDNAFTESVVMFSRGRRPEAARVARGVGIQKVRLITPEIRDDSAAATVSVVIGDDKRNFGA
jgi:LytR cell envelope-related transcriptional attenuator